MTDFLLLNVFDKLKFEENLIKHKKTEISFICYNFPKNSHIKLDKNKQIEDII